MNYIYSLRPFLTVVSFALVMSSAASVADEYRPAEFLNLDLSKAALSPKPLAPPNTFGPVPAKAGSDGDVTGAQARAEPEPHLARKQHARVQNPQVPTRTRLAHRHGNPLDAQAMDTRIQAWPCKSGAICKWKQ